MFIFAYLTALFLAIAATAVRVFDRRGVLLARTPGWVEQAALVAALFLTSLVCVLVLLGPTWDISGGDRRLVFEPVGRMRATVSLLVVTVLVALPLATSGRRRRTVELSLGWLMLIFSFVTGFSIGLYFVPVACLLFVAAASHRTEA